MSNKIDLCKKIQSNIANLSSNEIDELFKILYKNNSNYTKNNNGIFVNLNWIDEEILIEINNYINFCLKSQTEINKYEIMKNLLNISELLYFHIISIDLLSCNGKQLINVSCVTCS